MKNRILMLLALTLLALGLCACARADVVFSEVMASIATFVGERHDDWAELHNTGDKAVSLSGWYLSNDPYNLRRWAFPDTAKIAKGGYLVVYCAGKPSPTASPARCIQTSKSPPRATSCT